MPEQLGPAVPVAVWLVSTVLILIRPSSSSLRIGVISALSMAVLVPSFSTSATIAIAAVMGTNAVLLLALIKDYKALSVRKIPFALIAFILWAAVAGGAGAPLEMVLLYLATGALLALLAFAVAGAVSRGADLFMPFFPAVLIFEFLIGLGEEFFGTLAMWPRADGSDLITHRPNSVAPFLLGRAMGSTSQPIPYGILIGFCILVCAWYAIDRKSIWLIFPIVLGGVALLFSGTRNAMLGLALALASWFVLKFWRNLKIIVPFLLLMVVGVPVVLVFGLLAGGSELTSSNSFVHRLGILETAGNLFTRTPFEVAFGSGFDSIRGLIESGLMSGADGLTVIDQEFIRTLAGTGVVGLALLIAAACLGLWRGSQLSRVLLIFLLVGFLAFDSLSWRLLQTLFVFVAAYGYGISRKRELDHHLIAEPVLRGFDDSTVDGRSTWPAGLKA